MRKLYACLITFLIIPGLVRATHMSGGEIYWEHLGGDQYRIILTIYRDCAGIQLDDDYDLDITSPCGNFTLNVETPGGVELSQLCDQQLPNSTCNGGTLPGIQEYVYTGIATLPACDSWTISWTEIYRNNAIVNLQAPGTLEMYIEGVLNNADGPANDSPQFTNTAIPYICLGYPISYSYGAFDPEGDSLSYQFIGARVGGAAPIAYTVPFTGTQPISGITLDPTTGLVEFTLNQAGNWVVVVQVNEYDSQGNLIGTIMRDMQFVAYPCANVPPDPTTGTVGNMSGGAVQTAPYAVQVCESGDFCFDMVISDVNTNNILEATTNIASNLPGATFSYTGTNPITCHVCWNAGPGTAGFYPFIVNVNDGACPIVAFQTYVYSITVIEGLFIDVTTTAESCVGVGDGTATVDIVAGTGPYQYNWGTIGATTPSITAGAGTYPIQVTDGNGCVSAPEQAVIGTTTGPTANAGNDIIACFGTWPIQLNGSATNAAGLAWSNGSGTFNGTGGNAQYTPSNAEIANGQVDLVLTAEANGACPDATDVLTILISDSFTNGSVATTDATCAGVADGSAAYTPHLAGNTYLWNSVPAQTSANATGLGAGNYSVVVTDALGCSATFSATVGQPQALSIASITATNEACAGAENGGAAVVVTGGTAPYVYSWSTGGQNDTIVAGAGTFTVQVTDANGCAPVSGTTTIIAASQPNTANAGPDLIACMNEYPIAINGTVQNATSGTWSGGTGTTWGTGTNILYTPSAAEIASGGVDLLLTTTGNTGCPPAMDAVHITLSNAFLNAAITTTDVACNGNSTGTATFSPAIVGLQYVWQPGNQSTAAVNGLAAGVHTVTVTDALGCDTTMSITIGQPTTLTLDGLTPVDPTCAGSSNGSITAQASGGTPGYTYTWSANAGGQNNANVTGLSGGNYSLTIADANGCTVSGIATLNEPAPLSLTADVPDTVCVNAPVILTANAVGGTGVVTVTWAGIGTGTSIGHAFGTSQTVTVSASDAAGCTSPTLSFQVTVLDLSQASLIASGDTTVCPGGTAIVSAAVIGYPSLVNLTWPTIGANGSGPHMAPVSGTQSIPVVATDACGQSLNATVQVILETPPAITLPDVIAQGCAPLTVQFPAGLTTQNVTWLWDMGDGTTSTAPAPTHIYADGQYTINLTVTTPAGCSADALNSSSITAFASPTAGFTASAYTTDMSAPTIDFANTSTGAINAYAWEFGDGGTSDTDNPSHSYNDVGEFIVELTVTDVNGCTDIAQATITTTPIYDIVIPNAFTPNGNGGNGGQYDPNDLSNDVFYPFVRFVKEFKMRIWNRWGELVFESEELNRGWDGYYRGQLSPQDVYVYRLDILFVDDRTAERTGDITLFR